MTLFVFSILTAIAAAIVGLIWRAYRRKFKKQSELNVDRDEEADRLRSVNYKQDSGSGRLVRYLGIATAALAGLAVLFLVLASLTMVGTKKIGVPTSFGKPEPSMGNGLHVKPPWWKMTELDGAIQTDSYTTKEGNPITVRIGNQSTADSDVTIRWRIRKESAPDLFRDYRSFAHIRDSLVTRDLTVALNDAFATYNPLGSVAKKIITPPPSLEAQSKRVQELLVGKDGKSGRIGTQIEVLSVFVPLLNFDEDTQKKINEYQAEKANTRIQLQRKQTAINEAAANNVLRRSVSKDPNVLVSKCLDILDDMVKSQQPVPAGMTCWPGSGLSGVIADSRSLGSATSPSSGKEDAQDSSAG